MFSKRLKELREERNWSQQDLANKIGVTQGSLGNYETGTRFPKAEPLVKIARIFGVTVDYLMGETDERYDGNNNSFEEDLSRFVEIVRPKIKGVPVTDEQWNLINVFLQGVVKQLEMEGKIKD